VVLIMVLAVSLVEAFCILPCHLAHSLAGHDLKKTGRFRQRFERLAQYGTGTEARLRVSCQ
jgi:HAE1 family hydrophobic/amphiphilic exporter-1